MTISWPLSRQQVLDLNGKPRLDLRALFFEAGTSTPRAVYADAGLTTPIAQPVACDAAGRFPRVFLGYGLYRERVLSTSAGDLWFDDGLGLLAPDSGTVTPTPEVPANAYATTGDVKWRLDAGVLPGWVRMNGGTIGNAASGASERGNADTAALFAYLWSALSDDIASVVGGRGASAAADFAAGKKIVVPSMRGMLAGGLDTMGGAAAGVLQTVASITLVAGSTSATLVTSGAAARITVGMLVFADGLNTGTTVTALSGTTLTLSQPAAAGSSGTVSARFALFDVQQAGGAGGDWLRALALPNLPATLPSGSALYDPPAITVKKYAALVNIAYGDGGTPSSTASLWQGEADASTDPPATPITVTNSNPGGGRPIPQLQPVRLGTFFVKL